MADRINLAIATPGFGGLVVAIHHDSVLKTHAACLAGGIAVTPLTELPAGTPS